VNQQSLSTSAPSFSAQFSHHLALLSSKSDVQRRESLAHMTTSITSQPVDWPLPQPVSLMLPHLLPLFLDAGNNVRGQLFKFLRALPSTEIEDHAPLFLPYIRAGMTHLAADIRVSAVEILSWLIDVAGSEVVSCAGGWMKTLNCFLSLLGWHTADSAKWSSNRSSFGKAGSTPMVKGLQALAGFLDAGIGNSGDIPDDNARNEVVSLPWAFPLDQAAHHTLRYKPVSSASLNLFGQPRDEEDEMYDSREDRHRVFCKTFLKPIERGVENASKEGGEVGRASAAVANALRHAGCSAGKPGIGSYSAIGVHYEPRPGRKF
jgi:pre-rRNA-processing protein IPI1